MNQKKSTLWQSLLVLLFLAVSSFAQSARKPEPQVSPTPEAAIEEAEVKDATPLESTRLVLASNFEDFIRNLNELGKFGYRLEKSQNQGGDSAAQNYGGIMRLDRGNTYEYGWVSSHNRRFIETRLNFAASKGFRLFDALAMTVCDEDDSNDGDDNSSINGDVFRLGKGDVFLLEKKNAATAPSKEYKVFTGKIGLGKNPTAKLQADIDNATAGFRPVKILFFKTGLIDFSVSVVMEKDLSGETTEKTAYRFVKEINGFEKEVDKLAKEGYKILSGRRIGTIKYALMSKSGGTVASYSFVDNKKYAKDLPKILETGAVYQGLFRGDSFCDTTENVGGKLMFAQTASEPKRDYKIIKLSTLKTVAPTETAANEYTAFLKEGYQLKDLFYFEGMHLILEK
jgi:hypothetical protein